MKALEHERRVGPRPVQRGDIHAEFELLDGNGALFHGASILESLDAGIRGTAHPMAATPWAQRLAVAEYARPLQGLAVRNHAPADPSGRGRAVFRALSGAFPDPRRASRGFRGRGAAPVERTGLLRAGPQPSC